MSLFGGQTKMASPADSQMYENTLENEAADFPEASRTQVDTIISGGITVTGNLHGEGVIRVEGKIEGEVSLEGTLIVTPTGRIKGPINADSVKIAGSVEGNIHARDHLQLEKTGTIQGDVTTVSIVIEAGGCLNGRSTMIQPARNAESDSAAPAVQEDLQFGPNYKPAEETDTEGSEELL